VAGAAQAPNAIGVWSSWDIANIGDIAHTPGLLRTLEEFVPERPVILFANMLNEPVRAMLRRRFPKVEIHEGWLWEEGARGEELRRNFARCAVFVRGSNMGAETNYMDRLIEARVPFGVYGQTFPPRFVSQGEETRKSLARLEKAAFLFCREKETLQMLQAAGAKIPNLAFVPDAAFGMNLRDEAAARETMRRLGLEAGKFITIQLRTTTPAHLPEELPPGYDPKWNIKAPNLPLDTARAAKYRFLMEQWIERTGQKVLIAPEAKKEMAHNKRLLFEPLAAKYQKQVVNLDHFWNADEAAAVFARARVVVCHEPHSPILALVQGTPVLHTHSEEHGPKSYMFRDLGLGEWLLDHDRTAAEVMWERLWAIEENYPAAKRKVFGAMELVDRLRRESMAVLRQVLA
jgi:polysaccharide pyruvyl transferase WcaK-like protein